MNELLTVSILLGLIGVVASFGLFYILVYGFMVTPIGWERALWIWAYALAWLLPNDFVKLSAYRMLRAHKD